MATPLNDLIRSTTEAYLATLDRSNPPAPPTIESELLEKVDLAIAAENLASGRKGSDRLHAPKTLTHSQVADVIVWRGGVAMVEIAGLIYEPGTESLKSDGVVFGRNLAVNVGDPDDRNDGLWTYDGSYLKSMIRRYNHEITTAGIREVLANLYDKVGQPGGVPVLREYTGTRYTPVLNGVFDREKRTLVPFDPSLVFTRKIANAFPDDGTEPEIVQPDGSIWRPSMLEAGFSDDPEVVEYIRDVRRAVTHWNKAYEKVVMPFNTEGSNGKGTWALVLRLMMGEHNVSTLSLEQFGGKFDTSALVGRLANIGDETTVGAYLPCSNTFKSYATHDVIWAEAKFVDGTPYTPRGLCIEPLNAFARFKDKSPALLRRLVYVPFRATFKGADRNPAIKDDYIRRREVLEWFLWDSLMNEPEDLEPPAACKVLLENSSATTTPSSRGGTPTPSCCRRRGGCFRSSAPSRCSRRGTCARTPMASGSTTRASSTPSASC